MTDKEYYQNNKERIKKMSNDYYHSNSDIIKIKQKEIRKNNDHIKYQREYQKKYKQQNKQKRSQDHKYKMEKDPLYRLSHNLRGLIYRKFKENNYTKSSKLYQIIGCSFEEFKIHIEKQFKYGMSWENRSEWHLDHIYPVSLSKNEEEFIKLNHYTNFQPLWAKDNLKKGNKLI